MVSIAWLGGAAPWSNSRRASGKVLPFNKVNLVSSTACVMRGCTSLLCAKACSAGIETRVRSAIHWIANRVFGLIGSIFQMQDTSLGDDRRCEQKIDSG